MKTEEPKKAGGLLIFYLIRLAILKPQLPLVRVTQAIPHQEAPFMVVNVFLLTEGTTTFISE